MRYIIGIDLGTTNSCVAYIDTTDVKAAVKMFKIPQLIAEGLTEAMATLPSFCYVSSLGEFSKGGFSLPWNSSQDFFVGTFAREHGTKVPTRLVQSAKSWLCHPAANRRDKILPLEAAEESLRLSPIEATSRYLRHIREAWNHAFAKEDPEGDFDSQEIVLTVPASFDEVARTLTVEAARLAGFMHMTLLEEPQAAFYSWIAQHEEQWQHLLKAGSTILVCDVGGGTTDFSLIEVVSKEDSLSFQRMAVGQHLLLGGDNMDGAVAHFIEGKIGDRELSTIQRLQLRHEARKAKELLLQNAKPEEKGTYRAMIQGAGSSVVQGSIAVEVNKSELEGLLVKGFFGSYPWKEALKLHKTAGFRSMGLPYEDDPSITKHMAHFLSACGEGGNPKKPDYILFNGGALKPLLFQEALINSLRDWFPEKNIDVLPSYNLDLAVARGAAYYGKVRRGLGVKISGGTARGYYLILDSLDEQGEQKQKALTLLPRGSEEGAVYEPSETFLLLPNAPVAFQLGTSHVRLHDVAGSLVEIDPEEMHLLPPIRTILRYGRRQVSSGEQEKIPVHLHIHLTPIGTLEIGLKALKTDHFWTLEFQVRTAAGQDDTMSILDKREEDQTFDAAFLKNAEEVVLHVFTQEPGTVKPERLMEKLEEMLGMPRREWPISVMRGLADAALKVSMHRKASLEYACRWWNLIGFVLRPGFGYALDDFRMKELWKIILNDYKAALNPEAQIQMWICFRRVSGGLNKGQQMQLASDLVGLTLKKSGKIEIKGRGEQYPYFERIRALASFELIDMALKLRVGNALVERLGAGEISAADCWALGRIGARQLLYGSLVNVVSKEVCEKWIEQLLGNVIPVDENVAFMFGQLARKTGHREINVSSSIADKILKHFSGSPYLENLHHQLTNEGQLTQAEQEHAFGERLPLGLQLVKPGVNYPV